jgi:hypothetical protein
MARHDQEDWEAIPLVFGFLLIHLLHVHDIRLLLSQCKHLVRNRRRCKSAHRDYHGFDLWECTCPFCQQGQTSSILKFKFVYKMEHFLRFRADASVIVSSASSQVQPKNWYYSGLWSDDSDCHSVQTLRVVRSNLALLINHTPLDRSHADTNQSPKYWAHHLKVAILSYYRDMFQGQVDSFDAVAERIYFRLCKDFEDPEIRLLWLGTFPSSSLAVRHFIRYYSAASAGASTGIGRSDVEEGECGEEGEECELDWAPCLNGIMIGGESDDDARVRHVKFCNVCGHKSAQCLVLHGLPAHIAAIVFMGNVTTPKLAVVIVSHNHENGLLKFKSALLPSSSPPTPNARNDTMQEASQGPGMAFDAKSKTRRK